MIHLNIGSNLNSNHGSRFDNISIALVTPGEHPPHFAVVDENLVNEPDLKRHRDGIGYKYVKDPDNNFIEFIDQRS